MQRISHVLPTPRKTRHNYQGKWMLATHTRHDAAILAKGEEELIRLKNTVRKKRKSLGIYTGSGFRMLGDADGGCVGPQLTPGIW
jgi:hypothetical protein